MKNQNKPSATGQGAQHTPGPWRLDGLQNRSQSTTSILVLADMGSTSHGGAEHVAEITWPRNGLRLADSAITDEDWANARLIAAAPDLITALQKCVTSMEYLYLNRCDSIDLRLPVGLKEARAAIAKATEGTQ